MQRNAGPIADGSSPPRNGRVLAVMSLAMVVTGCSTRMPGIATRIEIPSNNIDKTSYDLTDYGLALSRVVNGDLIKPRALVESEPLLDSYFGQVAVVGPTQTPELFESADAKLAYVLNCHSASLLRSLLAMSTSTTVPESLPRGFASRYSFNVDGRWQTPADLHAWAKSLARDDWRVTLALATVSGDGPAVSNRPYLPELLDAQLDRQVRIALASPRVAFLDHGEIKQILFWDRLWSLRRRLIAEHQKQYHTSDANLLNVLLAYADSGFRRVTLNSAVGYAEHPMSPNPRIPWDGVMVVDEVP